MNTMYVVEATINGRKDGFHVIGLFTTKELALQNLEALLTMRWGEGGWYKDTEQYKSPHVDFNLQAGLVYELQVDVLRESAVFSAQHRREMDIAAAAAVRDERDGA